MTKSNWTPKFYLCVWIKKWTKKWILLFFLDLYMVFFSVKFRYFFINNFWIVSLNIWDLFVFIPEFGAWIESTGPRLGPKPLVFVAKGARWPQDGPRVGKETKSESKLTSSGSDGTKNGRIRSNTWRQIEPTIDYIKCHSSRKLRIYVLHLQRTWFNYGILFSVIFLGTMFFLRPAGSNLTSRPTFLKRHKNIYSQNKILYFQKCIVAFRWFCFYNNLPLLWKKYKLNNRL